MGTPERGNTSPMTIARILPPEPVADLDAYRAAGGGEAIQVARKVEPDAVIIEIEDSGLRGRGARASPPAGSGDRSRPRRPMCWLRRSS